MNAPQAITGDPVRRAQPWLGTLVSVEAAGLAPVRLHQAVGRALRSVQRVHVCMSAHAPDSELSRLNRHAHIAPVVVSPPLWRVLRAACRVSALTAGLFDVTVGATLARWKLLPAAGPPGAPGASWRDIQLGPGRTVRFGQPLRVDLGGIAKGYAVDMAIAALRRCGVPQGCVNAGGDLRFYGPLPRQIAVRDPLRPDRAHLLPALRAGAVATSCVHGTRKRRGRGWVSPVVNPHSGRAFAGGESITVLATACLYADALTKPAALDPAGAARALRRLRARVVRLAAP